jgi:hypothetical protein
VQVELTFEQKKAAVKAHYEAAYQVKLKDLSPHQVMMLWNMLLKLRKSEQEHKDRLRLIALNKI